MHPIVRLAASAQTAERKYVLFAGAGLSRDAGLPTAWDLMLATAALLRSGESDPGRDDLETWFKESRFSKMTYAELIGSLFPTPVEQRSFVHDKLASKGVGDAHKLIAELVRMGIFRCAITTNFDELLERALEEAGIRVQVIASSDELTHAEPLIHCKSFRVYKPHGTLGSGYLRNTPLDLEKLTDDMEEELIRVMSDHGLMVLGYAGHDESILRCLRARKHHRYPAFWVNPNTPSNQVSKLFQTDTFLYIQCRGAGDFLKDLLATYEKIASFVPNPGLPSISLEVINSIQNYKPDAPTLVTKFMNTVDEEFVSIAPDYNKVGERDDLLVEAIDNSIGITVQFAKVADAIASKNEEESALALYKGFGRILTRYDNPKGFSGAFYPTDFDFYKFIGHELFVCLFSILLKYRHWSTIVSLLDEEIYVSNVTTQGLVPFYTVAAYVQSLNEDRNRRLGLNRVSVEADILKLRHSQGELASLVPFREFMDADLFLYLRTEFQTQTGPEEYKWFPFSAVHMSGEPPLYLVEAERFKHANVLLTPLTVKNTDDLQQKLPGIIRKMNRLYGRYSGLFSSPLGNYDPTRIASR